MSTDLSRRAILAGAASAPALALPVVAIATPAVASTTPPAVSLMPDPAFAAIEHVIKTWDELGTACNAYALSERAVRQWEEENPQPEDAAALKRWKRRKRAAELRAGYDKYEAASDASAGAICEFCGTVPTTLAGAIAMLRFAEEFDTDWNGNPITRRHPEALMASLRRGLEQLAATAAVQS
jgi:hypothetical protein